MKNCQSCKSDEFNCACDNPSFYSDGVLVGAMLVTVAVLVAIGLAF